MQQRVESQSKMTVVLHAISQKYWNASQKMPYFMSQQHITTITLDSNTSYIRCLHNSPFGIPTFYWNTSVMCTIMKCITVAFLLESVVPSIVDLEDK